MATKKEMQNLSLKLDSIQEHLNKIEDNIKQHKDIIETKFANMMTEQDSIKKSNSYLSDKYNYLQGIAGNNKKEVDEIKSENMCLKQIVLELKNLLENTEKNLNNLEQYSRRECIEINGIPCTHEESTDEIVVALAKQVGVHITTNDISVSHHLKNLTKSKQPSTIIAKFVSWKIRNQIFENRFKLKKANLGKMIFINESLTRTNRKIFNMCRNFKKDNNWKYVWMKQGQTYLKKSDSDNTLKIESICDLSKYGIPFNHKTSSSTVGSSSSGTM